MEIQLYYIPVKQTVRKKGTFMSTNPSLLIQNQFVTGMNSHDLEKVMESFDDNASMNFPLPMPVQPSTLRGKQEIRQFLEKMIQGFHADVSNIKVSGDQVQWHARISSNLLKQYGLQEGESNTTVIVRNGKIISFTPSFTQESITKMEAASRQAGSQQWTGTSTRPFAR